MRVFIWVVLCFSILRCADGQTATQTPGATTSVPVQDTPWATIDSGANYNVWQKTTYETGPNGVQRPHIHKYVELASGLNYLNNGTWTASQELIAPYTPGAIAQSGPYQVIFANNLNTAGAIDVQTPDGKRLRSNIIGLGYYDRSTGNSVLIAQLQDSVGELISSNQVLYTNAFTGLNADVRYTYRRSGLEQDVILREQPQPPDYYGLGNDTTELEVMTAFINPPTASVATADAGSSDLEPDENISWGSTSLGKGRAFDLGDQQNTLQYLRVSKQYVTVQGQPILLEKVSVKDILPQLSSLPAQASNKSKLPAIVSKSLLIPKLPVAKEDAKPITLASAALPDKGYVLDYVTVSSAETNYTFQGDATYYVIGQYDLMGTTVIEGNSVIKMNTSGQIDIDPNGTIVCDTAAFRPAVFTSYNDNSVGQAFGSGSPNVNDAGTFLYIQATNATLHDLRFSYCNIPVYHLLVAPASINLWNCQFYNVADTVLGYDVNLYNVLIADTIGRGVSVAGNLIAENVTADGGLSFVQGGTGSIAALTNCLITDQALISSRGPAVTVQTNSTIYIASPTGPIYQPVGGGNYYLTNGSPYRGYGTTNVNPALLAYLANETTWPPVIFTNITFSSVTNFSPQAIRDTNANPDIGYHYDPIDYAFGGCEAESNMTFTTGTAVGWFRTSSGWEDAGYGIFIANQQIAAFQGLVTTPCYWVRLNTVQEDDTTAGYGPGGLDGEDNQSNTNIAISPIVQADFCRFSMMASESGNHARDDYGYLIVNANNSEFYSGGLGGYGMSFSFTNCLFDRCSVANVEGWLGDFVNIENCTFHGTSLTLTPSSTAFPINVQNCSFDGTSISTSGYGASTNDAFYGYNAYTNSLDPFPFSFSTNDVIVTNGFNWQPSWFGNYYLPTNSPVIAKGSTNANFLGLYHFTTQTNQAIEGNSMVTIGYHYVATDQYGNPLDSNGDGIPDYIEDANGNGLADPGEIPFGVTIENPINGSIIY